jgi:hypothetical protein
MPTSERCRRSQATRRQDRGVDQVGELRQPIDGSRGGELIEHERARALIEIAQFVGTGCDSNRLHQRRRIVPEQRRQIRRVMSACTRP